MAKLEQKLRWKILLLCLALALWIEYIHFFTDYHFTQWFMPMLGHILTSTSITLLVSLVVKIKKLASALFLAWGIFVMLSAFIIIIGSFLAGFGSQSSVLSRWEIENYEIEHISNTVEPLGSTYTYFTLRKYALLRLIYKHIDTSSNENDPCIVSFSSPSEGVFVFNNCEVTFKHEEGR